MTPNTSDQKVNSPNIDLAIPKWINEEYFKPILEKDVENFQNIIKFTPIAATAPGENYTSIMVRVVIDVMLKDASSEQVSYILKTCLENNNIGSAVVKSMQLFPKEIQMYSRYVSDFEKLYRDVGSDVQFSAKCLHHESNAEHCTLVLEDLKRQNFVNMDRLKGFDMQHMRFVLQKLAQFHAASAMWYEKNGPYPDIFTRSIISEANKKVFSDAHKTRCKIFEISMGTWGLENIKRYTEIANDFERYFEECIRVNRADPNEFNVLNHGDMWTNNIMFTHNNQGDVEKTFFIDFQLSKWGNPAQDLWYLFTTSVQLDIRIQEFDHFLEIYHTQLKDSLKILKYNKPIPSLRDIHISMLKYSFWAVFTSRGIAAMVLYPEDKESDMNKMIAPGPEADEFRLKVFSSPIFGKSMSQWYPFLYNKGAFDLGLK